MTSQVREAASAAQKQQNRSQRAITVHVQGAASESWFNAHVQQLVPVRQRERPAAAICS